MKVEVYEELSSTQTKLKEQIIEKKAEQLTFLVALEQTKGMGRYNRVWESQKGESLTFSYNLKKSTVHDSYTLPFFASFMVVQVLKKHYNIRAEMKWPNDVYLSGEKMAGVLVELVDDFYVVGVGVNLNQEKKKFEMNTATSLFQMIHRKVEPLEFFELLKNEITESLGALQENEFHFFRDIQAHLLYKNELVCLTKEDGASVCGFLIGLNPKNGGIILKKDNDEEEEFYAGTLRKI